MDVPTAKQLVADGQAMAEKPVERTFGGRCVWFTDHALPFQVSASGIVVSVYPTATQK